MKNKKVQSSTNAIILIFVVISITIFLFGWKSFSSSLLTSNTANLNTQSKNYVVNDLYGMDIDTSQYEKIDTTLPPYLLNNESQSNKDFSLEFQYSKEKSEGFWSFLFDLYNAPSTFYKLFRIETLIPDWLELTINGFIWVLVTASIIFLVRGIK